MQVLNPGFSRHTQHLPLGPHHPGNAGKIGQGELTDKLWPKTCEPAHVVDLVAQLQHRATAELRLKQLIVGGTDDTLWGSTLNPVDQHTRDVQPIDRESATQGVSRRIEAATAARELAEEQLAVEQGKFAAGTQTNFFVVQAQRDLAAAKDAELRAILDHQKALVELERAQRTSLSQAGISIVR